MISINFLKMDGMTKAKIWLLYLQDINSDSRLNVWHLALMSAIVQLAVIQEELEEVRVSRSKLMSLSHINTLPTYHKYFKQLQEFGYIEYFPSYDPRYRSIVKLKINTPRD